MVSENTDAVIIWLASLEIDSILCTVNNSCKEGNCNQGLTSAAPDARGGFRSNRSRTNLEHARTDN